LKAILAIALCGYVNVIAAFYALFVETLYEEENPEAVGARNRKLLVKLDLYRSE